jgi:hypothetical protein
MKVFVAVKINRKSPSCCTPAINFSHEFMTLNAEVLRLKQRWMQVKPEQTFVNYLNIFSRPVSRTYPAG